MGASRVGLGSGASGAITTASRLGSATIVGILGLVASGARVAASKSGACEDACGGVCGTPLAAPEVAGALAVGASPLPVRATATSPARVA